MVKYGVTPGGARRSATVCLLAQEVALSLPSETLDPIPADTVRIAQAAFRQGTLAMQLRDQLGVLYNDPLLVGLFSPLGAPALAPWRLALVSVLQFAEGLSDRQAADAVRGRIDWKYALGLELAVNLGIIWGLRHFW